jgi:hypothetical protein
MAYKVKVSTWEDLWAIPFKDKCRLGCISDLTFAKAQTLTPLGFYMAVLVHQKMEQGGPTVHMLFKDTWILYSPPILLPHLYNADSEVYAINGRLYTSDF